METTVRTELYDQKWDRKAIEEYQRESQFLPFMGTGMNKPISVRPMEAKTDNIAFVPDLTGNFVNGNAVLRGNETASQAYHEQVTAEYLRKGTLFTKREANFSGFDLRGASKAVITNFYKNATRTRIIDALLSTRASTSAGDNLYYGLIVSSSNGPVITSATWDNDVITTIEGVEVTTNTEAQKDTWLTNNADRVLFGSLRSNAVSLDHSTALGLIDTTDDTNRASQISMLKRMAKQASPRINPFRVGKDTGSGGGNLEWFLYLTGSRGFRDLQADPEIRQADLEARERGMANPVFTGGELLYNGVIIKEVEEMPVLQAAGASSCDVGVGFLLGNQALAHGVYQEMKSIADVTDYEFRQGLGTESADVFKKIFFNGKQHGVVTHYYAASADA